MTSLFTMQFVTLLVLVSHTSVLNGHRYSKRESSTLPTLDEFHINKEHEVERNVTNGRHANSKGAQDRSAGWSQWSAWSLCSRTCDGGVSRQLRTCSSPEGCRGEPVRYKICNMQPCSNASTLAAEDAWRVEQCAAHDGTPYGGELFRWRPHRDDAEPCALTCRGTPLHAASADHDPMTLKMSEEEDEEALVIAVLAPRVVDGTRCRLGSLDMCIDGRCQRVGCDLRVGSSRRVDECGVCGGDGATCARPRYHWVAAPASLCSASCGGGYKMSLPLCRDRVSGQDVSEQLCDASAKPAPSVIRCNTHACPYKWYVGEWSACSATCGGGARRRRVLCAGAGPCGEPAPPDAAVCGAEPCPRWLAGAWSGCSVSCGSGVQTRGVECGGERGGCDAALRPPTTRVCSTGIACLEYHETDAEGEIEDLIPGVVYHTQPLIQQYPPPEAKAEKLIGEQVIPSEATFIKDADWGPCSVTCGEGYRKREVHCKIFLEFSRTIAKLPDNKCTGPKPPEETERCVMEPCSLAYGTSYGDSNESPPLLSSDSHRSPSYGEPNGRSASSSTSKSYSWKEKGYTSCSASCLSGVQELIIQCVRDEDQKNASPYMCDPLTKPENRVRTCNDHPCPPRWNYTEFSPCTKSCGIGIQTREVNCIHEVTRGGSNTVVVPSNMCPQPPPPDRQYCNVLDCPVRWHTTDWSRCTKTCGGGVKQRKVECKQLMAQSHLVERPPSLCSASKPPASKPCNAKPCAVDGAAPEIALTNSSFIQHDHKKKTITVKVGASATLFYGTQIKIKCPVKGYNKTKIQWAKDHKFVTKSKNFKISKKGALKIHEIGYGDAGVYTCVAGRSSANLTLIVKPRPGEFVSSEEVGKQNAISMDPASNAYNRKDGRYHAIVSSDDSEEQSHEQRPGDFGNRKKMNKNRNIDRVVHVTATMAPRLPSSYDSYDDNEDNGLSSQISGKSGPDSTHTSNSGMRLMPNLLLLLSYLQMIWNLRRKFHGNDPKASTRGASKKRHLESKRGLRRRSRSHRRRNLKTQDPTSSNVLFIPQEESDVIIVHEKLDRTIHPGLGKKKRISKHGNISKAFNVVR